MKIAYIFYFNSYLGTDALSAPKNPTHYPNMDGYQTGDPLTEAYEGEIEVPEAATSEAVLESIYRLFNAPWERPNEYAGPSMSIGDVVIFNAEMAEPFGLPKGTPVTYAVQRMGFGLADVSESAFKERPVRWLREGENMKRYLADKREYVGLTDEEEDILFGNQVGGERL